MTRHPTAQSTGRPRGLRRRRLLLALLAVPLLVGALGAPAATPPPVRGDDLSDARAQQRQLQQQIDRQKQLIAQLNSSQDQLQTQISQTQAQLSGINDDLAGTKRKVAGMLDDIAGVQATYDSLVAQLGSLDTQLQGIEAQEATKKAELGQRKAELADRIRQADEAQRTSLLETFLSGATFTDMLAQMSAQLDAAEQDRQLAAQIADDRATLLSLHETVDSTRADTDLIRQQTAVQKRKLDQRLAELQAAQAHLRKLQAAAKSAIAGEKRQYAQMAANKAQLKKELAKSAAAKRQLQHRIDRLVAAAFNGGHIPSQYNGTLKWPMAGTVTQPFGCTGVVWEPAYGSCPHYHNGIDIVAPYGTPVRASGDGRVVYVGWNYADGADPAWIVIIAHSSALTTWYAHMQPRHPVHAGDTVHQGQVIGYEGNTGHSTGAHLHWMVELNGTFVNPKLFT